MALKSEYIDFIEKEFGLVVKLWFICFLKLWQK
jgi:hypothetical protein